MGTSSHPFGDHLTQHLHRKHRLSQAKLAAGIDQPPQVITLMCQGKRLTGSQARARVIAIIRWLHREEVLTTRDEARQLLFAAGMADLGANRPDEAALLDVLVATFDDSPAVTPLSVPSLHRTNLPVQLTRFIGRERELAELKRLLTHRRIVCLTGTGGCGKTRLALQVATELQNAFPDGVWFVEFASLTNAAFVPRVVAVALGLGNEFDLDSAESLSAHFRNKQMLLVLDNCEHLIAACAELAEHLLQTCPGLTVLATSREPLQFPGETVWRVPSMSLPDLGAIQAAGSESISSLTQSEAACLFIDRATAIYPEFTITQQKALEIAQICIRLDGIPLALELAAASVHAFSVGQIATRLDDRFHFLTGGSRTALPRHQTLRALIDWSYQLLSEAERTLLARLSVFAGSWTLEAAEAVAAVPVADSAPSIAKVSQSGIQRQDTGSSIYTNLLQLINKSLVVVDQRGEAVRYQLLETIREYAQEKLLSRGIAIQTRERYVAFFVHLAEEAAAALQGPLRKLWVARLEDEHDNLSAALRCTVDNGWSFQGLRLAAALTQYWSIAGHVSEGRAWLTAVLAVPTDPTQLRARAKAFHSAAILASNQDDLSGASALLNESLAIWRRIGDVQGTAMVLGDLSRMAYRQGQQAAAFAFMEESLAIKVRLADERGIASSRNIQGEWARAEGNYEQSKSFYEESRIRYEKLGDWANVAREFHNLGQVTLAQKNAQEAASYFQKGLTLVRELGNQRGIAACLIGLGAVAHLEGQPERAVQLFGAAQRILDANSGKLEAIDQKEYLRYMEIVSLELEPIEYEKRWEIGRNMTQVQAICLALDQDLPE